MKTLLVSDLHLDDKSENQYRWNIIGQIEDIIKENSIDRLLILGDLTDKKNRHDAKFVNELLYQLSNLEKLCSVTLLIGNHDYIDQDCPFFSFMDNVYYREPFSKEVDGINELYLPHVKDTSIYHDIDVSKYDVCFTHLDVKGYVKENNNIKSMTGLPLSFFKGILTFSGHIHVGQQLGKNFNYIGSPYSIIYEREDVLHRGIILEYNKGNITFKDVYFEFPRKINKKVKNLKDIEKFKSDGNFYKFQVDIDSNQIGDYNKISKDLQDKDDVKIVSNVITKEKVKLNNKDFFKSFCKEHKLSSELIESGIKIIGELK